MFCVYAAPTEGVETTPTPRNIQQLEMADIDG
jgi:hypothetical protein